MDKLLEEVYQRIRADLKMLDNNEPIEFDAVVPLDSFSCVAAGATVNICFQPQIPIRLVRLYVDSDVAKFFNIDSLMIGTNEVLMSGCGSIPAETFSLKSHPLIFKKDKWCQVGETISMRVVNMGCSAFRLRAGILGVEAGDRVLAMRDKILKMGPEVVQKTLKKTLGSDNSLPGEKDILNEMTPEQIAKYIGDDFKVE